MEPEDASMASCFSTQLQAATANQSEVAYIQWNPFVSLNLYLLKFLKGWGIYFILYLSPVPRGRSNAETLQMQWGNGAFQGRPSLRPTVCSQRSTGLWEKGASLPKGGEQKEENSCRKECPFLLYFSPSWKKGAKEDQYKPAKSLLMHLTFQRKINSNFTPTGCVAQLCQNVDIIKGEMTWLEGTKSLPPPHAGLS